MPPEYITRQQAADLAGVQYVTVRYWARKGRLRVTAGFTANHVKALLVRRDDVLAIMTERASNPRRYGAPRLSRRLRRQISETMRQRWAERRASDA
jgi:predicted site-specific integrase-resolvase